MGECKLALSRHGHRRRSFLAVLASKVCNIDKGEPVPLSSDLHSCVTQMHRTSATVLNFG